MTEKNCVTCDNYLGGGCCKLNVEYECAESLFELWEPKEDTIKE